MIKETGFKQNKPLDSMSRIAEDKKGMNTRPTFESGLVDLVDIEGQEVIRAKVDGDDVVIRTGLKPRKDAVYSVLSAETSKLMGRYSEKDGFVKQDKSSHSGQYDQAGKYNMLPWQAEESLNGRR